MRATVHAAHFLAVNVILYVEVLDFAGKLRLEVARIKTSNGSGTALTLKQAVPKFVGSITNRSQSTYTGNNYTLKFHPMGCLGFSRFDVRNSLTNRSNVFSLIVRDLDVELFLEFHDQFYSVQRVSAQIVLERRFGSDFGLRNAELVNDDGLYAGCNI